MFKNSEEQVKKYLSKATKTSKTSGSGSGSAQKQKNTGFKPQDESSNNKRKVSYDIMKNKGLTAHRKKENRNARVKKRNKYAKAQQKLKSQRGVFEGQQGPYVGELSGIRRNISRSTKLS